MDTKERLELSKLIKEYDADDNTQKIRSLKHSKKIRENIGIIESLKQKYSRMYKSNFDQFKQIAERQAEFLFNNYTNIFIRLVKNELNLNIMAQFLQILEGIEEGQIDQHEGSYKIGKLLKELYIDSVIQQDAKQQKRENKNSSKNPTSPTMSIGHHNISWTQFKAMHHR